MTNNDDHETDFNGLKNSYVATPTKLGSIVDISLSGLSFSSVDRGTWPGESFTLEIVAGEKEFYLGKIKSQLINDGQKVDYHPDNQVAEHVYQVQFSQLSKKQSFQLQYFLMSYNQ
jgi:hypothetical protein